jgi:hypothetical protein
MTALEKLEKLACFFFKLSYLPGQHLFIWIAWKVWDIPIAKQPGKHFFSELKYMIPVTVELDLHTPESMLTQLKVLYDLDCETDRIAQIQSLLLMTYWYETPDDHKDTWHWMGVVVSLALTIGLHKCPDESQMSFHEKALRKRMWWSCYMRDQIVALGMRRPVRLMEHDVPMLTAEDFYIEAGLPGNAILSTNCIAIVVEAHKETALICVARAKLCTHIGHVLKLGLNKMPTPVHKSPEDLDRLDEVMRCDESLGKWNDELPPSYRSFDEMASTDCISSVFVQGSMLHMMYFTVLSALHRPQVLPSGTSQPPGRSELSDLSRDRVREAAKAISKASRILYERDLHRYLPPEGVTVLLPAIIIHLLDVKSGDHEMRNTAITSFQHCMLVLESLTEIYASASFAVQFLTASVRKAGLDSLIGETSPGTIDQRILMPSSTEHSRAANHSRTTTSKQADTDPPPLESRILVASEVQQFSFSGRSNSPPLDNGEHTPPYRMPDPETSKVQTPSVDDGHQQAIELFYPSEYSTLPGVDLEGMSMASPTFEEMDRAILDFNLDACANNRWGGWESYIYGMMEAPV